MADPTNAPTIVPARVLPPAPPPSANPPAATAADARNVGGRPDANPDRAAGGPPPTARRGRGQQPAAPAVEVIPEVTVTALDQRIKFNVGGGVGRNAQEARQPNFSVTFPGVEPIPLSLGMNKFKVNGVDVNLIVTVSTDPTAHQTNATLSQNGKTIATIYGVFEGRSPANKSDSGPKVETILEKTQSPGPKHDDLTFRVVMNETQRPIKQALLPGAKVILPSGQVVTGSIIIHPGSGIGVFTVNGDTHRLAPNAVNKITIDGTEHTVVMRIKGGGAALEIDGKTANAEQWVGNTVPGNKDRPTKITMPE